MATTEVPDTDVDWRAVALDLARKCQDTDTFDVCTCEDEGEECKACEVGVAWRHAYVAVFDAAGAGLTNIEGSQ